MKDISTTLTADVLQEIFPKERSDDFFDALFGDANEGAFDIELSYKELNGNTLNMEVLLHEEPGRCLACNLTQGLPQVFSRHPIINVEGVVQEITNRLGDEVICKEWSLGYTQQPSRSLHSIPLTIILQ